MLSRYGLNLVKFKRSKALRETKIQQKIRLEIIKKFSDSVKFVVLGKISSSCTFSGSTLELEGFLLEAGITIVILVD